MQRHGHELKLVFPQPELDPVSLEGLNFEHFLLQPMDSLALRANTQAAIERCQARPRWRLSIQTHKILAIR